MHPSFVAVEMLMELMLMFLPTNSLPDSLVNVKPPARTVGFTHRHPLIGREGAALYFTLMILVPLFLGPPSDGNFRRVTQL